MTTAKYDLPDSIQVEVDGAIRIVRLNRPEQLNATNHELHAGLAALFPQLDADLDARVAVLTGNGRAFSAGGDFDYLDELTGDADLRRQTIVDGKAIVTGMMSCRLPVVAAVNGPAVGLGCSMVALSDIVYMAESAHLADPHVLIGLVAGDGGPITWPLMTSLHLAKEYALTGDRIPAKRAAEIGLANHVVPDDEVLEQALACARRIVALPKQASEDTKRILNLHMQRAVLATLDYALAAEDRSFTSVELRANLDRMRKKSKSRGKLSLVADDGSPPEGLTFFQRRQLKGLVKHARKQPGERLGPEDWEAYFEFGAQPVNRMGKRLLRALPSTPRCGFCGAPFGGFGGRVVKPLGFTPSRKNPNVCATCVELSPPGGMTTEIGVLFADLRGFTTQSESMSPAQTSELLRRFYSAAEHVLFPEALIDKFIGDEVMALYLPRFISYVGAKDEGDGGPRTVATVMLRHARDLLHHVGYGSTDGPAFAVGIGLDFGEAFIGNVGEGSVQDFTAVGDVVNTASRLQGAAAGGEIVVSARLAEHLDQRLGNAEELTLKGKQQPVPAYRLGWSA